MADFVFKISPHIILGSYSLAKLGQLASEFGSRYMIVEDPVLNEYKVPDKIRQSLQDKNIDFFTFDEVPPAATAKVLEYALQLARKARIQGVISTGGTRTANLGRAIASLYNESGSVYDFLDGLQPETEPLPFIEMPSTMRDPFMFIDRAPVIDPRNNRIKLIKTQTAICKAAIIDPNLFISLTKNQTTAMLIESLSMATDAYLSIRSNFFSDMIAEKAFQFLHYAMDGSGTLTIPGPPEFLAAQGGLLASLGTGTSSTGAITAINMAVNARYKTSKAIVSTILYPYFLEEIAQFKADRLAVIARAMEIATDVTPAEDAANLLIENIRSKIALAGLPARMKDLGLSIQQLALAAEDAGMLEIMNFLPRSMTSDDLFDLIKRAY